MLQLARGSPKYSREKVMGIPTSPVFTGSREDEKKQTTAIIAHVTSFEKIKHLFNRSFSCIQNISFPLESHCCLGFQELFTSIIIFVNTLIVSPLELCFYIKSDFREAFSLVIFILIGKDAQEEKKREYTHTHCKLDHRLVCDIKKMF